MVLYITMWLRVNEVLKSKFEFRLNLRAVTRHLTTTNGQQERWTTIPAQRRPNLSAIVSRGSVCSSEENKSGAKTSQKTT